MESIISIEIENEYRGLVDDLIKYSIIFLTINLLVFFSNPTKELFNKNFCNLYSFE